MTGSRTDRAGELARGVGLTIPADELAEVADRFDCLMSVMDDLATLDLRAIEPVTVFPDEPGHDA